MQRQNKKWKQFDFKPVQPISKNGTPTHEISSNFQPSDKHFDFEKHLTPGQVSHLAVNNKKVHEVERWLLDNVCKPKHGPSILLLTGPTGSGKTTTLRLLCKEMGIEVLEWVNRLSGDQELCSGPGQTVQFIEFLVESKYPSLLSTGGPKLTLVEDFPNSLIRNPVEFTAVLEKCQHGGLCVVFICSDAKNNNLNLAQSLFPQNVRESYSIDDISFNPCSATLMKQCLRRAQSVIQPYADSLKLPSQSMIDSIVASATGDIRCAMNQFRFACLKGLEDLPITLTDNSTKSGTKRKRTDPTTKLTGMIRDESLGLFHSLGRVLNPKRRQQGDSWRLQCDLETLIDGLAIHPLSYVGFLHENYLSYFGNIEDASRAADVFSLSQKFVGGFTEGVDVSTYGLWTVTMGAMVYNEHRIAKWNQIRKPQKCCKTTDGDFRKSVPMEDRCFHKIFTRRED